MALERIGLGGVFTFDGSQGVRGLKAVQEAARQTGTVFKSIGAATAKLGMAVGGIGLAATPLTAALGFGIGQAADFEKQMSAVSAITGSSAADMERLEFVAKKMGATTVFSASQSAQAMEFMGRAGFNTEEIISGLSGVMNAAAADGMELAQAADVISNVLKGMGLEANQAGRAADVLALTSARTNTNIGALGESFSYAAAQAKTMGIDLETTSAALGVISDAGIKGSAAGTSFSNMLVKLSKPSTNATKLMKKLGVQLAKNEDGSLNLIETTRRFNDALKTMPDLTERAAAASEIFGIRGQKAFNAMATAMDAGKLESLTQQLMNADGAAKEMAEKRLNNLHGQITLLKSAIEGFNIETFSQLLEPLTKNTKGIVQFVSDIASALLALNSEAPEAKASLGEVGSTALAIAKGVKEGITAVGEAWSTVRQKLTDFIKMFTGGVDSDMTQSIAKFATIFAVVLGAIAPVLIAIGGLVFFITTVVVPAFAAIGTVIGAVAALITGSFVLPIVAAIGVAVLAWRYGSDQIKSFVSSAVEFGKVAWSTLSTRFNEIFGGFIETASRVFSFIVENAAVFAKEVWGWFKFLGEMFMQVADFISPLAKGLFSIIAFLGKQAFEGIVFVMKKMAVFGANALEGLGVAFGALLSTAKPVMAFLKNIAKFIIEDIVDSIVTFTKMIVKLADAVNIDVSKGIREFANQGKFRFVSEATSEPAKIAKDATESRAKLAKTTADVAANQKAVAAEKPELKATVEMNDHRKLDIKSCLQVDGKEMSVATARHKTELSERAGFKSKRWQQRFALEQGAEPIRVGGT